VPVVVLDEIVQRLAGRAGTTEADIQSDVRALLLYGGLNLEDNDLVVLEAQVGAGRRIDVEAGTTAIEVKKTLAGDDAHSKAAEQLAGYIESRTEETGLRWVGILTDGVLWELHHLAGSGTQVVSELRLTGDRDDSETLPVWLEGVLATAQNIQPTPKEIYRRLGSESSSMSLDYADLRAIYAEHKSQPSVALKRELWGRLLASALGTHFANTDELFVLHTYLVVTAELIAHSAVGLPVTNQSPTALLSGEVFRSAQIGGVVEADFFDWPVETPAGGRFVGALSRRIARFDWSHVDHDVLKALYESVIDAETRKQLGEYYTPDWLAEGVVEDAISDPLQERVLDPACGSGTFLFWAARRYLAAAEAGGRSNEDAIRGLVDHVAGIDLHPVAVSLARVTYLLAIGSKRLQGDRPPFSVPVYLGDSLRWEQDETLFAKGGITIFTTDGAELFDRELHFPERVVADAGRFDQLVAELATRASSRKPRAGVPKISAILQRLAVHPDDQRDVENAFRTFCDLHDEGRDHIWGYYVRNLARPLWFARPENRVDVLLGNPPWLSYRFMPDHMQEQYREFSQQRGLWAGGKVSTHQDLSDLFVVRAVEQYLREGGSVGFVMPASVLSRRQFAGFRTGYYEATGSVTALAFATPWDLRGVTPDIFPVPAAVIFGRRASKPGPLPQDVERLTGRVEPRGTRWGKAREDLASSSATVESGSDGGVRSPYEHRFYQGAIIIPRVLLTVRELPSGPLGGPTGTRRVTSLRSRLEKPPWKDIESLEGLVEHQFLRRTLFGSSIAPFRVLDENSQSVIPWSGSRLLDSSDAELDEFPGLAEWWRKAEGLWKEKRSDSTRLSLREQLDYYGKLSGQFPLQRNRVVYTKSGVRITACRVESDTAVVDHTLYWAAVDSIDEGLYLTAILNSDSIHEKVEPLMSEGLFGKRHVDKYVFAVPFPTYDPDSNLHRALAAKASEAEEIAGHTELDPNSASTGQRKRIRQALAATEVKSAIEGLVTDLLETVPAPTV
jgi:SAM-dependent methyltransferase